MNDDIIARVRALAESGKYDPPRGKLLGRLRGLLDVYEGSPPMWIDALAAQESTC
jgi:hypothetical protein